MSTTILYVEDDMDKARRVSAMLELAGFVSSMQQQSIVQLNWHITIVTQLSSCFQILICEDLMDLRT